MVPSEEDLMWNVIENGELKPLALINVRAKCAEMLANHDTSHLEAEYPFCEDYGCQDILDIAALITGGVRYCT